MENRQELLDSLVDIRDVKIDRSLPVEERMRSYVVQIKNPYMFKCGNTVVRVSYADTTQTIDDCLLCLCELSDTTALWRSFQDRLCE